MRITRLLALGAAALSLSACYETTYGDPGYYGRGYYGRDYYGVYDDPGYYGRGYYGSSGPYEGRRHRDRDQDEDLRGRYRHDEHDRPPAERPAQRRGPYIESLGRYDLPSPEPLGGGVPTH